MSKKLPVVAAIPAYNAETTLGGIIEDVLEQGYDDAYVLDDCSADNTVELASRYRPDIKIIKGSENVGAGANRNRIIAEVERPSIIHFLDSDVRLNSKESPKIARELGSIANLGFVGGLIRNPDGSQNPYNFGPRASLWNDLSAGVQYGVWMLGNHSTRAASAARILLEPYLKAWPNIYQSPVRQEVFWASEANMVIPSEIFRQTGGYDPEFRYSEILDYSILINYLGLRAYFDPSLDVTHNGVDLAGDKAKGRAHAAKQLRTKYGWGQWLFGVKESQNA